MNLSIRLVLLAAVLFLVWKQHQSNADMIRLHEQALQNLARCKERESYLFGANAQLLDAGKACLHHLQQCKARAPQI